MAIGLMPIKKVYAAPYNFSKYTVNTIPASRQLLESKNLGRDVANGASSYSLSVDGIFSISGYSYAQWNEPGGVTYKLNTDNTLYEFKTLEVEGSYNSGYIQRNMYELQVLQLRGVMLETL